MSELQDDVSRIVGGISFEWNGKDYVLDNFGIDDLSVVQQILLREKRVRILHAVEDLRDHMPSGDWSDWRREALDRVGNIGELSFDDARELIASEGGLAAMVWVMVERKYPQQLTRKDCEKIVSEKRLTDLEGQAMMQEFLVAMGWVGNSTGRSGTEGSTDSGSTHDTSSGEPVGAPSQTLPVSA